MRYIVRITPELILGMCTPGHEIRARCLVGIPEGVKLIAADYFEGTGYVELAFVDGPTDEGELDVTPIFEAIK